MEKARLHQLILDSNTPKLRANQDWDTIHEELRNLKVSGDLADQRMILYLYQLKTKGEKIWRAQAANPKATFERFLSKYEIFDANRYKDGEVVLERVDPATIKGVGFAATVLITRRLDSHLWKSAFKVVLDYKAEHGIQGPLLQKVVQRVIDEIRRDPSNTEHVRTNTQSALKRARLREATSKVSRLETENAQLLAEVEELKAKIKNLRAENRKLLASSKIRVRK